MIRKMDTIMVLMKKKKKNIGVIFLLMMFASLISTAFAGRGSILVIQTKLINQVHQEQEFQHHKESNTIHERLLRVNAKDYGNYDPTPTFSKPPYKLIPN
ncbi:protein CASPARIAN STRIP INTEGRITY FACTOR 1-like [Impatiens glandulifera]|uniref:protein CASPARIAN STRIP INTEGRITY FACTOR 1-like n=1 Tax=Impatiens glandulifera TaxID=253017 RepID=UPI001FB17F4F|nr:protein CASPARIAN STRIP INTEGRITY FACTOR 1-like [Impatiens glandulifera]